MSADNYGVVHPHGDGWGLSMGFASTVELWGFEFRWRASGSYPLEYRRAGGCRHDWEMVPFDHPLVVALRAAITDPGPVHLCEPEVRSGG